MKKNLSVSLPERIHNWLSVPVVIWIILAITLFFLPFLPDEKLVRLKLQLLETGVFIAFSVWLLWICFKAELFWQHSPIHLPILLYVVYSIALYFFSPHKPVAMMEVRRILLCFGIFAVSSNILTTRIVQQRIVHVWLLATGMIAFYGILQHYGGIGIIQVPRMDRVMGTSGNPIFFAAHLIVAVPLIFSLIVIHKNIFMRICLGVFLSTVLIAIFFTKTRAAYLALVIGCPLWFVLKDWLNHWVGLRWIGRRKWVIAGIILSFVVIAANKRVISFVSSLASRHQAHTVIWRDTLSMWISQPFFGKGLGTYTIYFPDYASEKLKQIWPQRQFIVNDAHNEYLQILAETGIVGLGLFVWILVSFFLVGLRKIRFPTDTVDNYHDKIWTIGILLSSLILLIQNFFSVDMRFAISGAFLFLMIGMILTGSGMKIQFSWYSWKFFRWCIFIGAVGMLILVGKGLIAPYQAQRRLASEPDFFEQKILEPARTIRELQELAQKYPGKASVFEKLGWVYAKEKKWNKAIKNYKKAARINPKLVGAYNNMGNIYFTIGERKKALGYYKKALAIDPDLADAHMNAGIAYYYEGRLRESAEHIKRVIELDPDNAKAQDLLKRMSE